MKKFFNLFALVFCFTFLATTAVDAQIVRNDVNCEFTIQITYAKMGQCTPEGSFFVTVDPLSTESLTSMIPADTEIIRARGRSTTLCSFHIGATCTSLPQTEVKVCIPPPSTNCDNYTADWESFGVWLHN
ncbi:MAG: hypothetical protein AAFZ15_15260 [Bacteroidota bacterium]